MRILAALFFAIAAGPALADIEPGSWEMTVATTFEGMPGGGAMAPITQTRCLTGEDARDPSRLIGAGAGCTFTNKRDTGAEITFDVVCTGQVPVQGKGAVRYSARSVEGTLELTTVTGAQKLATRSQLSAKRLGECKS